MPSSCTRPRARVDFEQEGARPGDEHRPRPGVADQALAFEVLDLALATVRVAAEGALQIAGGDVARARVGGQVSSRMRQANGFAPRFETDAAVESLRVVRARSGFQPTLPDAARHFHHDVGVEEHALGAGDPNLPARILDAVVVALTARRVAKLVEAVDRVLEAQRRLSVLPHRRRRKGDARRQLFGLGVNDRLHPHDRTGSGHHGQTAREVQE